MESIGIETSRHVRLSYQPASLLHRILAWLVDAALYLVYVFTFLWIWSGIIPESLAAGFGLGWIPTLFLVLPYFIYFPLIETVWDGRTIGKKLLGIRVVKSDGTRASLGSYIIRWLFRFFEISGTGGVIAILTILINGKGQRLGDIVANTSVILERQSQISREQLSRHSNPGHDIVFQNAAELDDKDIRIIKNLLNSDSDYSYRAHEKMMQKTRSLIEAKTGASDPAMSDREYLITIIKDYTTIYSSEEN